MSILREALQMFVNEKEFQKFRIALRYQNKPWRRDDEEDNSAAYKMKTFPNPPIPIGD